MANIKEDISKPTLSKPVGALGKGYQSNFNKTMQQSHVNLNETDGLLTEREQSLKKKIFSLAKMEALVFADPKLSTVYDEMSENGEEKYGYHYNETIMNMLFNDYVLNSPKYLQKYKMAIPKKKKRRDKSGINQLKKAGDITMHKKPVNPIQTTPAVPKTTPATTEIGETTGAASSGAFAGPAAWKKGGGDLLETTGAASSGAFVAPMGGKGKIVSKPIWKGGSNIQESNYLTDPSGFAKFIDMLNEEVEINPTGKQASIDAAGKQPDIEQQPNQKPYTNPAVNNKIIDKTAAFSSNTVKQWNKPDTDLELHTVDSGTMDEPQSVEEEDNSNFYQNLQPKDAILKAKNDQALAMKQNNQSQSDKISAQLKNHLASKGYNYKQDPYATDVLGDFVQETIQSIIDDKPDSVAKGTPTGTVSTGNVPVGLVDMKEEMDLLNEIDNELNAYSIHQKKLQHMSEDRKPSSLVLKDRLGAENQTNFKKDFANSDTKDVINIEKELQWKDQQTDVPTDPMKLGQDIENAEIKSTDAKGKEYLKNVGNSTNDKGDEIPKRNMTTAEQDEVNLYRKGMHSLVYDNKPDQRFEDRMKADMGDAVYEIREKQMAEFGKAPMYNKEAQPTQATKAPRTEFDKEKSGWNDPNGLSETMISGRYRNALDKSHIIDFAINEVMLVKVINENLFPLDFTGLGNSFNSKTVDYKVSVNEGVIGVLDAHKFYTNGKVVYAIKNPKQNLSEAKKTSAPVLNEEMEKMKHLLGYKPNNFVSTDKTKKNRGF